MGMTPTLTLAVAAAVSHLTSIVVRPCDTPRIVPSPDSCTTSPSPALHCGFIPAIGSPRLSKMVALTVESSPMPSRSGTPPISILTGRGASTCTDHSPRTPSTTPITAVDPAARPLSVSPLALSVAYALSRTLHLICLCNRLPRLSRAKPSTAVLSPTSSDEGNPSSTMSATAASRTVIRAVATASPLATTMSADPLERASTSPVSGATLATCALLVDHRTFGEAISLPALDRAVTLSWSVSPTSIRAGGSANRNCTT